MYAAPAEQTGLAPKEKQRHREPRSGVAIQRPLHWIASSALPPRNDCCSCGAGAGHWSMHGEKRRHREPRSGVANQRRFLRIASSALPPRSDCCSCGAGAGHGSMHDERRRHREPRSGVAIQRPLHWIASSALPPRNDCCSCGAGAGHGSMHGERRRHREPRGRAVDVVDVGRDRLEAYPAVQAGPASPRPALRPRRLGNDDAFTFAGGLR